MFQQKFGNMRKWQLLLLFVRLVSVIVVQTSFVADEYWQSLEIAHFICFGYGYKTWEWKEGIRSYLFPMMIAAIYKILQLLGLDYKHVLVIIPRLLVALLTWAGDVSLVETAGRLWGPRASSGTAWSLATSWCLFYCGSRTLANTVEMALLAVALRWYPWRPETKGGASSLYLSVGALATAVRPTAALAWLPLWVAEMASSPRRRQLLLITALIGVSAVGGCLLVDSLGHGSPLLSPLAFLRHNVLGGVASHYGTSPWRAHLTASLPTLLGVQAVPVLLGVRRPGRPETLCLGAVLWLVAVYSALPHKEFRFLLSIWPFCALLAGKGFVQLSRMSERWCSALKVLLVVTNLPAALYLGLVHQRGPLDVTAVLAARLAEGPAHAASVLYLMPCHSTPLYSHLHVNVATRFLTCEPNLEGVADYTDEADRFYQDPELWLRREYPSLSAGSSVPRTGGPAGRLPSHVVLFDGLWRRLEPLLRSHAVCGDVFHAHVSEERRGGRMLVLCREGWETDGVDRKRGEETRHGGSAR
ncbi:GPI mannosyltransferase 3 [Amphibalanus amphitrite]|uniref:Mannosyltransferase n=1 Tax=Amphibalanus amphitrite TaxID=1232801 RepID=A0A6A4VQY8_AMPAM|nr:GPI mannosyltransferase 3 [Amphibalanus amphitrite]